MNDSEWQFSIPAVMAMKLVSRQWIKQEAAIRAEHYRAGMIWKPRFKPPREISSLCDGWLSRDDVRIAEDMNPIPDGDNYWR